MRALLIIPAFNEERALEELLPEFLATKWPAAFSVDAVVVNDASLDNTSMVPPKFGIPVLDLPVNLGIGGAMQTGFHYAAENGYDIAVQMDGDGQHPPSEVARVLNAVDDADVYIGSRFLGSEGFHSTVVRRIGIRFFNFLIRTLCGITVTDCTSGLRAMNRRALARCIDYYPDEYPEPESIIVMSNAGLKIKEVSVTMRERTHGSSSIRALSSVYYTLKVSVAMLLTYIRTKSARNG